MAQEIKRQVLAFYRPGRAAMPPALRDLLLMKTFNLSYAELNSVPATDLEILEKTAWARVDYFYERLSQATEKGAFGFIADALYLLIVERLL